MWESTWFWSAGGEVAGNAWRLIARHGGNPIVTVVAGRRLLAALPGRCRRYALHSLAARRIRVLEGILARRVQDDGVWLEDGVRLRADVTFIATGVEPSSLYRDSELPTGPGGGLLTNDALQSVARPEMFGGGGCIEIQGRALARVGLHAVRQGETLRRNLLAALEGRPLSPFEPKRSYLIILNMGDGTGITRKGGFVHYGPQAFRTKDLIDRRFVGSARVMEDMEHSAGCILPIG